GLPGPFATVAEIIAPADTVTGPVEPLIWIVGGGAPVAPVVPVWPVAPVPPVAPVAPLCPVLPVAPVPPVPPVAPVVTVIAALVAATAKPLLGKNLISYCPACGGTTRGTVPAVTPGAGGAEFLVLSVENPFHDGR